MNNQKAFDIVVSHLKRQKNRSVRYRGAEALCSYQGDNELKCAIGALIPDNEYKSSFEGHLVPFVQNLVPALQNLSICLLMDLQNLHDQAYHWNENGFIPFDLLKKIGKKHRLNTDSVDS